MPKAGQLKIKLWSSPPNQVAATGNSTHGTAEVPLRSRVSPRAPLAPAAMMTCSAPSIFPTFGTATCEIFLCLKRPISPLSVAPPRYFPRHSTVRLLDISNLILSLAPVAWER